MKPIHNLLVWLLVTNWLSAQTTLTLDDCIRTALEQNTQIRQSGMQLELAEINLKQTRAGQLPELGLGFGQAVNFGRSVDRNTNDYIDEVYSSNGFGLQATMPVFNGFSIQRQARQQQLTIQAGRQDVEASKNLIRRNVVQWYLQVLANQELLRVAREQMETTRQQIALAEKRVAAGVANEGIVYELQAQLSNEEFNAVGARNAYELAKVRLFREMNQPYNREVVLDEPLIPENPDGAAPLAAGELFQRSLTVLPEIQGAQFRTAGAEQGILVAKSAFLPTVNTRFNFDAFYTSTRGEAYFDQLNATRNGSVSLSVYFPIFRGGLTHQRIAEATVNQRLAQNDLDAAANALRQEIEEAAQNYEAARQQLRAAQQQVRAQTENLRLIESRFNNGTSGATDYILAKNNLARAMGNLVSARYNYAAWSKIMDFYSKGRWE